MLAFSLRGGPNTSSKFISIFIIKIFTTLNISDPTQWLHLWITQGVGAVGGVMGTSDTTSRHSWILVGIGRNTLVGNRKKIAKFLMRTFTCRSTFLYDLKGRCKEIYSIYDSLKILAFKTSNAHTESHIQNVIVHLLRLSFRRSWRSVNSRIAEVQLTLEVKKIYK